MPLNDNKTRQPMPSRAPTLIAFALLLATSLWLFRSSDVETQPFGRFMEALDDGTVVEAAIDDKAVVWREQRNEQTPCV